MVLVVMLTVAAPTAQAIAGDGRGGVMGFFAGCCFGLRAGVDYNDGKELHWREWCRIIPIAGLFFGVWDGVECAQGAQRADFVKAYGSTFY